MFGGRGVYLQKGQTEMLKAGVEEKGAVFSTKRRKNKGRENHQLLITYLKSTPIFHYFASKVINYSFYFGKNTK